MTTVTTLISGRQNSDLFQEYISRSWCLSDQTQASEHGIQMPLQLGVIFQENPMFQWTRIVIVVSEPEAAPCHWETLLGHMYLLES